MSKTEEVLHALSQYLAGPPMGETAVLYTLTTLAQTCAALAAFVGAVAIFRLQILRDQRRAAEIVLRALSEGLTTRDPFRIALAEVLQAIEQPSERDHLNLPAAIAAHATWQAFGPRLRRSRWVLIVFELWNLAVIGASLIGFNYVPFLKSASWTFGALWAVVVGTVLVTVGSVIVWTQGVEQ
jgi:hypothetical protein